jgi:hypothetical protein
MSVLMWEVRAAAGRLDELLRHVLGHADPAAQVYRSSAGPPRVVVIDPTGRGVPELPAGLAAPAGLGIRAGRPRHPTLNRWHSEG